jgi:hypothetical protein
MLFRKAISILPLITLMLAPACTDDTKDDAADNSGDGDGDATTTGDGDGDAGLAGECDPNTMVGAFVVQMELDYTAFSGAVSDSVVDSKVLQPVASEGDCRLVRKENSFCDPLCASDEVCDLAGECVPAAVAQNLGSMTLTGTNPDLAIEPTGSNKYNGIPEHPGFDPDASIRLQTTGGDTDPLDLRGGGFEPVAAQDEWLIEPGQPIAVSWDASAQNGPYTPYVRILLNVDQHGSTPVTLICDVEDSGSMSIPAGIVDMLLGSGISGFPSGHLYRRTSDSTQTEWGCAQLTVESHAQALIDIVGHTPCQSDSDCSGGQVCDVPNETCVDP